MSSRIMIVGGDAAGMSAASQIRRRERSAEIAVFEKGEHTSYSACGIPFYVGGLVDDLDAMVARTPQQYREKMKIDVRTLHEVVSVDVVNRSAVVRDIEKGGTFVQYWDKLLIATGALPMRPPVPGIDAEGVFGVNTLGSGIALKQWIEKNKPAHAVIVGGGYIGLEMAEACNCRLGIETSVVERAPHVMGTLDADMGIRVGEGMIERGITLYLNESLVEIVQENGRVAGVKTDKRTLEAEMVILGLGVVPNAKLAADAGLALGPKNAISIDDHMRTSAPNVWAAGDCAESLNIVSGKKMHIALGTVANKQGRIAGINMSGGDERFPGVLGTAICRICKYEIARTGMLERELEADTFLSATIESPTKAGYMPDAGEMYVKLIANRADRRVVGAQIVGTDGAAKRIDTLATAITAKMTVDDVVELDLSYSPPFSTVWDPVQQAARVLQGRLGKK